MPQPRPYNAPNVASYDPYGVGSMLLKQNDNPALLFQQAQARAAALESEQQQQEERQYELEKLAREEEARRQMEEIAAQQEGQEQDEAAYLDSYADVRRKQGDIEAVIKAVEAKYGLGAKKDLRISQGLKTGGELADVDAEMAERNYNEGAGKLTGDVSGEALRGARDIFVGDTKFTKYGDGTKEQSGPTGGERGMGKGKWMWAPGAKTQQWVEDQDFNEFAKAGYTTVPPRPDREESILDQLMRARMEEMGLGLKAPAKTSTGEQAPKRYAPGTIIKKVLNGKTVNMEVQADGITGKLVK